MAEDAYNVGPAVDLYLATPLDDRGLRLQDMAAFNYVEWGADRSPIALQIWHEWWQEFFRELHRRGYGLGEADLELALAMLNYVVRVVIPAQHRPPPVPR
jgi:hypothetical protein